jgi:hypothetical protein
MKNGKVTTDAALAHMKRMLPSDIRDRVMDAIETCRHAGEGELLGAITTVTQSEAITRYLYLILTTDEVTQSQLKCDRTGENQGVENYPIPVFWSDCGTTIRTSFTTGKFLPGSYIMRGIHKRAVLTCSEILQR